MKPVPRIRPHAEPLPGLGLELARERSLDGLLGRLVERIAALPPVATAGVWLIRPGDLCASCPMGSRCPQQVPCLHLVASASRPAAGSGGDPSPIDAGLRRCPLGVLDRKRFRLSGCGTL